MQKKLSQQVAQRALPQAKAYQIHDTLIGGFVLRVQPSGKKIWKLIRRRKPTTLGNFPAMTFAMARTRATQILGGAELPRRAPTLDQFIDQYYRAHTDTHHARPRSTRQSLRKPGWGDMRLDDIRLADAEQFRLRELKQGVAPASVNRYLVDIKAALQKAVDWDLIPAHPLARLKPLKIDKSSVTRYLSPAEEERLYGAMSASEPWLQGIVVVALNTGLRKGELLSLTWGDVAGGSITVHGSRAKSGQTRHVPLNDSAATAFKKLRGDVLPMPGVVIWPMTPSRLHDHWRKLLKRAEVENFRFHDMRHHFASKLVMAAVPLNTARELLGHSNLAMTTRYAHLAPENLQKAVELIG